ncbi:MAG: polysaccharide deacetylase family protein [Chthoniobacterales bacterium]|nr:polysaccharide deacetylase family protein [Chthoniobacterales bacterium]
MPFLNFSYCHIINFSFTLLVLASSTFANQPDSATSAPNANTTLFPPQNPGRSNSKVAVIGYHRFENPARDPLAITPEQFRAQLQQIRDSGITVISMEDFLAWRRREKEIPERSALITIDDGFNCTYYVAWPILREFGYPFTFFVYSNFINKGGRSITWEQLREMQQAGVTIGSHSVSHDFLTKPKRTKPDNYDLWLENEFTQIRNELREHLGTETLVFAYPYGVHNAAVRQMGLATGYTALFTVSGKHITRETPSDELGRFIVQSDKPETFLSALKFGPTTISIANSNSNFNVTPSNGSTISDLFPLIQADIASIPDVDPKSIEMRISGIGSVPLQFDSTARKISYQLRQRLHGNNVTILVRARSTSGKRYEFTWNFQHEVSSPSMSQTLLETPTQNQ